MNKKLNKVWEEEKDLSDNELQRKLDRFYWFSTNVDKENNFWNDNEVIDSDIFSNDNEEEENVDILQQINLN